MKAAFGPQKAVQLMNIPSAGAFSLDMDGKGNVNWHTCREQFASVYQKETAGFFFSLNPGLDDACADFVQKTEEIIDIKQRGFEHSEFSKATKPHCLWIKPSSFWSGCEIRRSFLTVLLRCGINYNIDQDNYEHALFSVNYFSSTREATKRFLFGFTEAEQAIKYVKSLGSSSSRGWHYIFSGKTPEQIKEYLTWPSSIPRPSNLATVVDKDAIWT